jgi:hypothetical protein
MWVSLNHSVPLIREDGKEETTQRSHNLDVEKGKVKMKSLGYCCVLGTTIDKNTHAKMPVVSWIPDENKKLLSCPVIISPLYKELISTRE